MTQSADLAINLALVRVSLRLPFADSMADLLPLIFDRAARAEKSWRCQLFSFETESELLLDGSERLAVFADQAVHDSLMRAAGALAAGACDVAVVQTADDFGSCRLALRRADASLAASPLALVTQFSLPNDASFSLLESSGPLPKIPGPPRILLTSIAESLGLSTQVRDAVGIVIAALALHQKILPGQLSSSGGNGIVEGGAFYTSRTSRPWTMPLSPLEPGISRRAGVLLEGGKQLLLEEFDQGVDECYRTLLERPSELFTFSAASAEELCQSLCSRVREIMSRDSIGSPLSLLDYSYHVNYRSFGAQPEPGSAAFQAASTITENAGQSESLYRLAIVAESCDDLLSKLNQAIEHLKSESEVSASEIFHYCPGGARPQEQEKIALVYPGLGAAYPDMLVDLCFHFPEARQVFDFVDWLAATNADTLAPSSLIFPVQGTNPWGDTNQAVLARLDAAVVIVLMAEYVLYKLLRQLNVVPDYSAGASTGEFAVLCNSNCFEILESAPTFYKLSTAVSRSVPDSELASLRTLMITASIDQVEPLMRSNSEPVYLGADMTDSYLLVSGRESAIAELSRSLKNASLQHFALPIAIPYHTPLVAGKISDSQQEVLDLSMKQPQTEMWSCSLAGRYPDEIDAIRKIATELFEHPILLRRTVQNLHDAGARIFIECGPRGGLLPLITSVLHDRPHLALAANLAGRSAVTQLQNLLAALYARGVELNLAYLYRNYGPLLQARAANPQPRDTNLGSLPYGLSSSDLEALGNDEVMLNYLHTVNEFHSNMLAMQEQIMISYLQNEHTFDDGSALLEPPNWSASSQDNASQSDHQVLLPFLQGAKITVDGDSAEVRLSLDLDNYPFLLDHAIGGSVSALEELPVSLLPLMVALEIMAESAALLDNRAVIRLKDVRAQRRISIAESGTEIEAQAARVSANEIACQLFVISAADRTLAMSVTVVVADAYPCAGAAEIVMAGEATASRFSADTLYGAGGMFHGPTMQSVRSVEQVMSRQICGLIQSRPSDYWFDFVADAMLVDPLLLDNASQMVLFHLFEQNVPVTALLPFHIESIDLFAAPDSLYGQTLTSRARLSSITQKGTLADVEVLRPEGTVVARVAGVSSRAIMLDAAWRDFVQRPRIIPCARQHEIAGSADVSCAIVSGAFLPTDEVTVDWLTDYFLREAEQREWLFLNKTARKRARDWLLGRLAAKSAVCQYLSSRRKIVLAPRDVTISSADDGSPRVIFKSTGTSPDLLSCLNLNLSISHRSDQAVAIVVDGDLAGVDLEVVEDREEGFAILAFSAAERQLIESLTKAGLELRLVETVFWSCREAAAKATGIASGESSLRAACVLSCDWQSGRAELLSRSQERLQVSFEQLNAADGSQMVLATCLKQLAAASFCHER